jgi:broad specificity phosphatase PhoE
MHLQLWLVRHGETEWSASGQHTGRTDLPLTLGGKLHARQIAGFLGGRAFTLVLTSPLQRARETCRLAGYGESAIIDTNLREWDYGEYEGRTTPEIQIDRPGWSLWRDGAIDGERIEQVAARAQKVIDRAAANSGDVLVFAHGHILRVLAACWLDLPPDAGRLFALGTASVSVLGYERDTRVITQWNGGAKGPNSFPKRNQNDFCRKCTSRMRDILTMHLPDRTPEYLRKRKFFSSCASSCSDKNAGLKERGETHDPY